MTFNQITGLYAPEDRVEQLSHTIAESKQLLKMYNTPYRLVDTVEGPETKVLFDAHFVEVFRSAQSTECLARMSKKEKEIYWDYVTYQQAVLDVVAAYPEYTDEEVEAAALTEYENNREYNIPELVVRTLAAYEAAEVYDLIEDTCYAYNHVWEE